jgi:4-amino-4-deoxy-L-arabinose transferase-like glycosyltransferase
VVLLIAGISCLLGLGAAPLLDWDENMQSEVARQALLSGDLLQLTLNGQPFTEKPPLFFLEMAAFFKLFGVSETTARMTTAVNGLLFLAALFWIARVLVETELAALWSLLFASAFLPLLLSRAAVVEHTFNALMALGALTLVAYDETYSQWRETARAAGGRRSRWRHWAWLVAAAAALGLAVLAKGPSGGAVPLVAFAGYKLVRRGAPPHPGHWLACGVLSLAVALSWYAANYVAHGGAFVREFARFMGLLFARPLEGHSGPFYYHWAVALVGLFPWTPLLLLYALPEVRRSIGTDPRSRALAAMGLVWAGFILVVFSLVKTKLPHYSSGMYVPLTLLAALALMHAVRLRERPPGWICALMAAYGLAMAALFAILPYRMAALAEAAGAALDPPPGIPRLAFLPGVVLGTGTCLGAWLLFRGRAFLGVALTAAGMGAFMIGAWRVHLPLVAAYNQGPMLALVEEAYGAGGDLALYENVSYAALFYGRREIEMVGTYKFAGDPARLDAPGERPLYVIAPKESRERLRTEHPRLTHVRDLGALSLYRLAAKGESGVR